MTLDEAIKHCEENACGNSKCNKEHKQLSEWLRKLQRYEQAINKSFMYIDGYYEHESDADSVLEDVFQALKVAIK